MARECECPKDHSVTKLGHCQDCPFNGKHCPENDEPVEPWLVEEIKYRFANGCGAEKHHDGTSHDFNWATYCDDTESTGVCRCRIREIDYDMRRMP